MIQVGISDKHISAESVSSENTCWALKRTVLSRCELGDVSARCFPLQHNACVEEKNIFKYPGRAFDFQNHLFASRGEGEQILWLQSLNVFSDFTVCFRLDTMVRTWGTAPSARGCSWFCGWKEWSLRWLPLTWGSKHPPPLSLLWHKKHFLSIWSWGLSHRTLIKRRHKRERERERGFLWVIQNSLSHLINRCVARRFGGRSPSEGTKSSVSPPDKHLL